MEHAPRLERTALVVDDDVFVLSALAELLEDDGYDVHTASNGFSALRRVVEHRPAVVLLDLALPERSGKDILEDLRADPITRDMAIVVVTGNVECLTDALRAEADGIVTKPFDTQVLLATVEHALQRAACRRAEVAPVAAAAHRESGLRARRGTATRRTRGRR
jgi:two-component system, OmpR family, alkaline phosphatase synthesis response regulator PhoP